MVDPETREKVLAIVEKLRARSEEYRSKFSSDEPLQTAWIKGYYLDRPSVDGPVYCDVCVPKGYRRKPYLQTLTVTEFCTSINWVDICSRCARDCGLIW